MRIRQIRFRNINSFYGEHPPITFTDGALSQTGLFVIAGPTGAGKSTLLDVITLALFNRVPRITDGDGRGLSKEKIIAEGLIINQKAAYEPKAFAYAEVEYELKGQAYRSRWSMDKNRNGNWNDYEMEVAKLPNGEILSGRKRDVPGLNTEQIGLTYEQFIRSMVLAQGAFDKFLKASAGDRSKLLEQITGTDIYRKLSQRAHVVSREYDDQLRDKEKEVGGIRLLPKERVTELTEQRSGLNARIRAVEKELTHYRAEAALLDTILTAEEELVVLSHQQTRLDDRQRAFAPKAERLSRHAQVADFAHVLADLVNAEATRGRAQSARQTAETAVGTLQAQLTDLITQGQQLTGQPTLGEQTFHQDISAFRDRIVDLVQQIRNEQEKAGQPLKAIRVALETSPYAWVPTLNPDDVAQMSRQVAEQKQQVGVQLVQLEDTYPTMTPALLNAEIDRQYEREKQLQELIALQKQQQERLLDGMNLKKLVDEKRAFVTTNQPTLRQLAKELEALTRQREELEQRRRQLSQEADLEKLRDGLVAGEPCPLCGSTEHPYVQHYVQQAGTIEMLWRLNTEEIRLKQQEYEQLNREIVRAEAESERLDVQRDDLRRAFTANKQSISEQLTVLTRQTELQPGELLDMQKLAEAQRRELTHLQALWEQEALLNRLAADLCVAEQSAAEAERLRQQKEQLFSGDDVREQCSQLTARFNHLRGELATQTGLLDQSVRAATDAEATIATLLAQLKPLFAERGLPNAESARACLLDASTLRQLQGEQRTLADEALGLQLRREQTEAKRQTATEARQTELSADAVGQLVKDLTKEQRQQIEQLGNVKAQLEAHEKDCKRQTKLAGELQKLTAEALPWRELNRLIGSAKGDEYSRFAQSLTLSQLIGLANRRLRDLSDRYLLLKPRDGQDELYVVDQYQGGAERTVTSLSGGETFTLSLGLALALSDLASQNVQIDSLFVDEGFGTLDPESLDTAIVMLEKLQQDSQKTIGIISHRHEIKERISVQIQVEKGNDGNSRVKVVEL